jgi:hypothetical protein
MRGSLSWLDRIEATPLWAVFLYRALVVGGAIFLIPDHRSTGSMIGLIVGGLLAAVFTTGLLAVIRRRGRVVTEDGQVLDPVAVARAFRTGDLPEEPSGDEAFLAMIQRRRSQLGWVSRVGPWLVGSAVLLGLVGATHNISWIGFPVGYAILWRAGAARRSSRLDQLESSLRGRSPSKGAQPSPPEE